MGEDLPLAVADAVTFTTPAIVILNGIPITRDVDEDVVSFCSSPASQLKMVFRMEYHPVMYPRLTFNIFSGLRYSTDLERQWLGRVDFYIKNMSNTTSVKLSQKKTAESIKSKLKMEKSPDFAMGSIYLNFEIDVVRYNFDEVRMGKKQGIIKEQIDTIKSFVDSVTSGEVGEVELYVQEDCKLTPIELRALGFDQPQDTKQQEDDEAIIDATEPPNPHERVRNVFRSIQLLCGLEGDPLRVWFARSPDQELLNAGTILEEGKTYEVAGGVEAKRPTNLESVDPQIRFLDGRQYKIPLVYGMIDNVARARNLVEEAKQIRFLANLVVLPRDNNSSGNPSTVAVVIPTGRMTSMLPRKGVPCEIEVHDLTRTQNKPYKLSIKEHFADFLDRLIDMGIRRDMKASEFVTEFDIFTQCSQKEDDLIFFPEDDNVTSKEDLDDSATENTEHNIRHDAERDLRKMFAARYIGGDAIDDQMDSTTFVSNYSTILQFPVVKDAECEDKTNKWHAVLSEVPFPLLDGKYRIYFAKIPLEPWYEGFGGEPRRCNFSLPRPGNGERFVNYVHKVLAEDFQKKVTVSERVLIKTLKQTLQAHGELQHPQSTPDGHPIPSETAQKIYKWLPSLDNATEESKTNCVDIFPSWKTIENRTAPSWLLDLFDSFDESKKQTFLVYLKSLVHPFAVIPGTAACGKTLFAIFLALLTLADPDTEHKILILAPTNAALDDYEATIIKTLNKLGAQKEAFPRVERVHSIVSETNAAVKGISQVNFEDESDELDATDFFIAEIVLSEYQKYDQKGTIRKSKRAFHTNSLHASVLDAFFKDPGAHATLNDLRARIIEGGTPSKEAKRKAELEVESMYKSVLNNAHICLATPSAAGETFFRREFKPTLVILDENAITHELTTLMTLSAHPITKLFTLFRNLKQFQPFVTNPGSKKLKRSFNRQLQLLYL